MPARRTAAELLALVLDGDLSPWDVDVVSDDPLAFTDTVPYTQRLADAREAAGTPESVVTGRGRIGGHDVAIIAGEFTFLAGTMGVATARKVVRAFDRAVELRLPVLGLPISGGTRMQEGTVGFVQMAAVTAAAQRLRRAGLPYIVYLRDPTTGGVLASWGSRAHISFAEPGALIGLTGPRVIEQVTGEPFPPDVQRAENLCAQGIVDAVVAPADLAERVATVLDATAARHVDELDMPPLSLERTAGIDGWRAVVRSRRTDRPGIRELLGLCARDVTPLRGDGAGTDDPGCIAALARVCGVGAVVVGHDRVPGERGAQLGAAGYRKAQRAFRLADELGLPIVTVIDTRGAAMTPHDESHGLAAEIAGCLAALAEVSVPTMSLLLGEGSGGGALAFLPTDRVVAAEHAWLAPIAPEGASSILHRTTERAPDLARAQATGVGDLQRLGIVDVVIPDRPPPGEEGERFGRRIAATAAQQLSDLLSWDPDERLAVRAARYHPDRGIGAPATQPERSGPAG